VPDSDSDRMAAAEEELKELVKAVSIRGRKWADSKDALKQAENQQAKVEHLLCVLAASRQLASQQAHRLSSKHQPLGLKMSLYRQSLRP